MSLSKLFKVLLGLALVFGLCAQIGCTGGAEPGDYIPTDDNNGGGTNSDDVTLPPAASETPGITITSLFTDITVAQGQPILLTWQIQNLPANAFMNVLYRSSSSSTYSTLISNLNTSSVGSLQIDTYNFVAGLSYNIMLQLTVDDSVVATASTLGEIEVALPSLTVTAPVYDQTILPSSTLNVTWTGSYLPAGAELQTFFDLDKNYANGNEIIVKTDTLPATSSLENGSITLEGTELWANSAIARSNPYYIGLRVVKNGQTTIAKYSTATAKLFGGANFAITSPANDLDLRTGDAVAIGWSTAGMPAGLTVDLYFADQADSTEIVAGTGYAASSGGATVLTTNLVSNHTYGIYAKLLEGTTVLAVVQAEAIITVTTEGSTILISNSDLLLSTDLIQLGLDNTYNIQWEVIQSPSGGVVDLYVDMDGDYTTTDDQIKITPDGGVDALDKNFDFTPVAATFTAEFVGQKYFVIARLTKDDVLYDDAVSVGQIRVGAGGFLFTAPIGDTDLLLGEHLDISWDMTGSICAQNPIIKFYVDTQETYDPATAIEITPLAGLDACGYVQPYEFQPSDFTLNQDTGYYIIGRLLIPGNDVDETQVATDGQFTITTAVLTVLTPAEDVESGFDAIDVSWTIEGLAITADMKVRILAYSSSTGELPISGLYDPEDALGSGTNSGVADASGLPPGTYDIRCEIFSDASGSEIRFVEDDADGQIIVPDGYNGVYQLSDMAAAADPEVGYSPIDGTIFEGYLFDDLAGYEVAALGDLGGSDNQGLSDFIIFSRYGKLFNSNQPGAGYLVYGKDNFPPVINLNQVAAVGTEVVVEGTQILFPMENAPVDGTSTEGEYFATTIPDISGDGKADLVISCQEAAPLFFEYDNLIPRKSDGTPIAGVVMSFNDHLDETRLVNPADIAANPNYDLSGHQEFAHVKDWFSLSEFTMGSIECRLYYGDPEDIIVSAVEDDLTTPEVEQGISYDFDALSRTYGGFFLSYSPTAADDSNSNFKPGSLISITAYPCLAEDESGVEYYAITCKIFKSGVEYVYTGDPADPDDDYSVIYEGHQGVCYMLTSDRLSRYENQVFDMVNVGEFQSVDSDLTGAARDQMLTADPGGTNFGASVALIPTIDSNTTMEMVITDPTTGVTDWLGDNTERPEGGRGLMFSSTSRFTSRGTNIYGVGTTGSYTYSDDSSRPHLVELLGSETGAHLTSVSMMNKPAGINGFSSLQPTDFNGDGKYDLILGAPGENGDAGAVYLITLDRFYDYHPYSTSMRVQIDLNDLNVPIDPSLSLENPIGGIKITGDAGDKLGESVKSIGDFNGDGYADFVIAMPEKDSSEGATEAGRIMIVFGKDGIPNSDIAVSTITSAAVGAGGINALILQGVNDNDHVGTRVCAAYDINNDGYGDLIISAPDADDGAKTDCGKVYIIYGRGGIITTLSGQTFVDYDVDGNADDIWSIDAICDTASVEHPAGMIGAVFVGEMSGDSLSSITSVGDVNGDGIGDFLIGAPYADTMASGVTYEDTGKAYLILGREFNWPEN